jgi:uncharacterized cupin superfamily protein
VIPAKRDENMTMSGGVTKADQSLTGRGWSIHGQSYLAKAGGPASFAWFAMLPANTSIPAHYHSSQDEFVYVLDGRVHARIDETDHVAHSADLIHLPRGLIHTIENRGPQPAYALCWVSPANDLMDFFAAIDGMTDSAAIRRIAATHGVYYFP